jgi:hypothetical protein
MNVSLRKGRLGNLLAAVQGFGKDLALPVRHNLLSQFKGKILHPNPEKLHLFA